MPQMTKKGEKTFFFLPEVLSVFNLDFFNFA